MFRAICSFIFSYIFLLLTRKKKKTCLLIADFAKYGGTKTYFISILTFLLSKNYNVTVLISSSQIDQEVTILKEKFHFNIQLLEFDIWRTHFEKPLFSSINKTYILYQINELLYFWKILRKLKISLLICSGANPEWLLFLLFSPCKVVYILHTATMDKLDHFKKGIIKYLITSKKKIVVVSKAAKSLLLLNWFDSNDVPQINVIHNYFEPKVNYLKKNSETVPVVLTIGATEYYKNPLFWIEVAENVIKQYGSPVKFVWAGDGSMFEDCTIRTRNHPLIHFIGFTDEIDNLYQSAWIYFQPSIFESHGISVLGAMYNSIPCIVSNKGGLVESVINNETGYIIDIDRIEDAISAILLVLNNSQLQNTLGSNGHRHFNAHFSKIIWEKKMDFLLA